MKNKSVKKLPLHKIEVSKLNNLDNIKGGLIIPISSIRGIMCGTASVTCTNNEVK
ncbi:hypothetical protein M0D21_22585 [Aquimarina sp. D1M17]|uniref:hypothetical protein n=1 Tax=Aquimarina acroporae TaxID=2937283 RepID=UPI0020BED607|nr:hypothetical protein [Aquimarina acroporae]MCK8524383.1 hypothetical protein [Aquimarina acroporae]